MGSLFRHLTEQHGIICETDVDVDNEVNDVRDHVDNDDGDEDDEDVGWLS
jgi:hypothetical protein